MRFLAEWAYASRGRQRAATTSSPIQYHARDGRDVAMAHSFQGDGGAFGELGEEAADGAGGMVDAGALDDLASDVPHDEQRVVLACPQD